MAASNARYRIHAVAQSTGVSTATLRAWERRYGIPAPTRGSSGYRLYTSRDIDLVKRMVELGASGVAPSEAARIVRSEATQSAAIPVDAAPPVDTDAFDAMVSRLLTAASALDQELLERELYTAMGMGSAWLVYSRVLSPVLVELGSSWAAGKITVGHEHLASQALGTALRNMIRLLRRPDAERVVVLACVDEEQHDLPLYGVGVLASTLGWVPRILGPRTPPQALAPVVESAHPALVGLSVTVPVAALDAAQLFQGYGRVIGSVPWVVGGAAAGHYQAEILAAGGQLFSGDADALRTLFDG